MSRLPRTPRPIAPLIVFAAAAASTVAGTPAHALPGAAGVPISTLAGTPLAPPLAPSSSPSCPTPATGDDCRAAYSNAQCWPAARDICGPVLSQEFQTAVAAVPDSGLTPFVRPKTLFDINGPVAAQDALLQSMPTDRAIDTTSLSLFSLDSHQPIPPPLTYTGTWLGSLLTPSAAMAAVFDANPWEADDRVTTCGEYVYKKFYDYEGFAKRAAGVCGTNWMCVYRLATDSPVAIDGAGLWRTLRQRTGGPNGSPPIDPPVFSSIGLAYDMHAPDATSDQVIADEAEARRQLLAHAPPELGTYLSNNPQFFVATPKNPFFAYDISFLTSMPRYQSDSTYQSDVDNLIKLVDSGRRYYAYADEWKYHAARVAAQGNMTDAEREDIEDRVHAYRAAIGRLKALIAARLHVQGDIMDQADAVYRLLHNRLPGDPDPLAQLGDSRWVNVPMSAALPAAGVSALITGTPAAVDPSQGATTPGSSQTAPGGVVTTPGGVLNSPSNVLVPQGGASIGILASPVSAVTGTTPQIAGGTPSTVMMAPMDKIRTTVCIDPLSDNCLYATMEDVHALLDAELNHPSLTDPTVIDQGCLNMNDSRCDWSAKDFADQWLHLYKSDLEKTYASCLQNTGNDDLSSMGHATDNVVALENYFAQQAQNQANAQAILGPYTQNPSDTTNDGTWMYGETRTGGNSFGSPKTVSMDYTYSTYWHVASSARKVGGKPCTVEGEVGAQFTAHADVLKQGPWSIVDTDSAIHGHGGSPSIRSHLSVLGEPVYNLDEKLPEIGGGDRADPSLCASDVFVILVIPVTVEMCLAAHYGYDLHLGSGRETSDQVNACDATAFSLDARIKPWASTDVTGSIAVGVPDIEAGVRGDIEVLRMELEANANFGVGFDGGLSLKSKARIDMNEMSGKVELFGEALFAHAEKTIFEWPGLHEGLDLWDLDTSVQIDGLTPSPGQ